jgi:hypothetical protein
MQPSASCGSNVPELHRSPTDRVILLCQAQKMKKDRSNKMTIEQIRAATRADVKKKLEAPRKLVSIKFAHPLTVTAL